MEGIADSTLNYITKKAKEDPEIEFKSIMQGFSLDCITKVAFGMETNCHLGEDKALFELSKGILKDMLLFLKIGRMEKVSSSKVHRPQLAVKRD